MQEIINIYGRYIPYLAGVLVLVIVSFLMRRKAGNKAIREYLEKYPNAGKVYLTNKNLITSQIVSVHSVDGEVPVMLIENGKSGFYVKPGESEIEISYTYTRPGVTYQTVSKTYGPVKQVIEIEPSKSYYLSFDKKKEDFSFEEQ